MKMALLSKLRLRTQQQDRRAKDGEPRMSLEVSGTMVGLERVARSGSPCSKSMEAAGAVDWHSVSAEYTHDPTDNSTDPEAHFIIATLSLILPQF